MTAPDAGRLAQLTVVGSGGRGNSVGGVRALVSDGTAASTVGGIGAGGFGVEAFKSFAAAEPAGRWWFVAALVLSLALVAVGLWQRSRARRQVRVGLVVTAIDARRGGARAWQLEQQAETFSRDTCTVTLKARTELPGELDRICAAVDSLAEETMTAVALAERLTPDAAQINLVPTMPLHVAFRFGAHLGYTHARDVVVHSIRQADGAPAYFPAVSLRATDNVGSPLVVGR